jgi:hypothetical protein
VAVPLNFDLLLGRRKRGRSFLAQLSPFTFFRWPAAILTEKSERSKNHSVRFQEPVAPATPPDGAMNVPLAGISLKIV